MARRGTRGSGIAVDPLRVREARQSAGLSLAQVAGTDFSRTFLHFIEKGRARPSRAVLNVIARRTGRPASFFLAPAATPDIPSPDLAAELVSVANRIRRWISEKRLADVDYEAMRLLEASVRQGAHVARAIDERSAPGPRARTTGARRREKGTG